VVRPIITICLATLISSAPAATLSKNDEAAREAAIQWLQLVDSGRYDEAASQGSQEVRGFEQWLNFFRTHGATLGRVNKRQFAGIKRTAIVPGVPEVRRYYMVQFKSSFEHRPTAVEEIVLTKIGCCWEIFGYTISDR
jgi:hypothetical protein